MLRRACTRAFLPLALASAAALTSAGCGGGPDEIAYQNQRFYAFVFNGSVDSSAFEQPWPDWDLAAQAPNPEYKGVAILGGRVHISRPTNWIIRDASNTTGQHYIEYVSPNEYIFAVYERWEYTGDLWRDIITKYEKETTDLGGKFLGQRVPVATWNTQGRAYVVERSVAGQKAPYENTSREYLLRGEHRVVLVQVVHQGHNLAPISDELYRVITSIEVL